MPDLIPIKIHTSNALQWLGSLYKNPADALKEHVSNAVDEHEKAIRAGKAASTCKVEINLEKDKITIEYPYGMSRDEFERALQNVADSAKKSLDVKQIGQLGIGMFSFFQFGKKCIFYSKKDKGIETIKVTVRAGSEDAEFEIPLKREKLETPGIKIVISEMGLDPTKARGHLSPANLQKVFSEKFDPYLRNGSLEITLTCKAKSYTVEPQEISLPRICKYFQNLALPANHKKEFSMELYFDPSGKGSVSIRHTGVVVVENFSSLFAYGLEESVYGCGDIKGYIDADFLKPLPARTGFEENQDWEEFLDELDKLRLSIEEEVDEMKREEAQKKLTEIQKKAIEIASEILNLDEFKDLELLDGFAKEGTSTKYPIDGFAFVPASIRLQPSKTKAIYLKAVVPDVLPDCTEVHLSLTGISAILKSPSSVTLFASDCDEKGIVTIPIILEGQQISENFETLVARATAHETTAKIKVAEPAQSKEPGEKSERQKEGSGINYVEKAFEDGSRKHSRYISKVIEANDLNEDYLTEVKNGNEQTKTAYAALMIGKETIAFNDSSGGVDDYLEKMLSYHFKLKNSLAGKHIRTKTLTRGRPRKI